MPVAPQVTYPGVYIQELPGNENKCQVTNQVSLDCHTREGRYPILMQYLCQRKIG